MDFLASPTRFLDFALVSHVVHENGTVTINEGINKDDKRIATLEPMGGLPLPKTFSFAPEPFKNVSLSTDYALRNTRIVKKAHEIGPGRRSDVVLTNIRIRITLKIGGIEFEPINIQPDFEFIHFGGTGKDRFFIYKDGEVIPYKIGENKAAVDKGDDFEELLDGFFPESKKKFKLFIPPVPLKN